MVTRARQRVRTVDSLSRRSRRSRWPLAGGRWWLPGLVCAAYGVMESEGGVQERGEPGKPGDGDFGPQQGGAAGDVVVGAGVAREGSDVGEEDVARWSSWVKSWWARTSSSSARTRLLKAGDQGDVGLGDGPLARGVVLFCLCPCGFEGGDDTVDVAVGPADVAQDPVVAALPAEGGDGGKGSGDVAMDAARLVRPRWGTGSRARTPARSRCRGDHPRGCGEQVRALIEQLCSWGPSPRARGGPS